MADVLTVTEGVKVLNKTQLTGEQIFDELRPSGWERAGKGLGSETLKVAIKTWRDCYPGIELISALGKDRMIYLFYKTKPQTHVSERYVSESRTDNIFQEFAQWFGKYGQKWTEDYKKDQGMGWSELPVKPRSASEYNKVFVDFAQKGYEVYSELRGGFYFIYVKKLSKAEEHSTPTDVYREFTDLYRKHGKIWEEDFKNDRGKGWQRVGTAENEIKYEKMFVDYAKKGCKVYGSGMHGAVGRFHYIIFVKGVKNFTDLSFDSVEISTLERGLRR